MIIYLRCDDNVFDINLLQQRCGETHPSLTKTVFKRSHSWRFHISSQRRVELRYKAHLRHHRNPSRHQCFAHISTAGVAR